MSLKYKLFLPLLLLSVVSGAFVTVSWLPRMQHILMEDHQRLLSVQMDNISESIMPLLLEEDLGEIYSTLDALLIRNENWQSLAVYDARGRLMYPLKAPSADGGAGQDYIHRVKREVSYLGEPLARLEVVVDFSARYRLLEEQRNQLLWVLLSGALTFMLVSTLTMEFFVRRPVSLLSKAAEQISDGDYMAPLPHRAADEVGDLVSRFDGMRNSILEQQRAKAQEMEGRKQAQQESENKSRKISAILEGTTDAYMSFDQGLRLEYINHKAEQFLGLGGQDVIGRKIHEAFPIAGQAHLDFVYRALAHGEAVEGEVLYQPTGKWLEVHVVPMDGEVAVYMRDISRRKKTEEALQDSEQRQRAILENVADGIITSDSRGTILTFNRAAEKIFGYEAKEIVGQNLAMLMPGKLAAMHDELMQRYAETGESGIIGVGREVTAQRGNGEGFPVEIAITEMSLGQETHFIGMVSDITERKQAEEQLRLSERVFSSNNEGIVITDERGRILRVNSAFTKITGYEEVEVLGETPAKVSSGKHDPDFYQNMWRDLKEEGHWQGEIWNRRKSGEVYPEWLSISAVRDEHNATTNYVGVFSDITEKKEAEARIFHMAHHDSLTGLPNRVMFDIKLGEGIERATQNGEFLSVLYLDLDRFKQINDTLGHPAGDELLQEVARRLTNQLRNTDVVCRVGGDEFIVLLQDLKEESHAGGVAQKVLNALSQPFTLQEREVFISASIGVALFPQDAGDQAGLIKNADTAMFQAKDRGRNNYQFYSQDMNVSALEKLSLESKLRRALDREEFILHFQPQMELGNSHIIGAEALVRWQNEELGLVSPADFIPLLEETGMILPVGEWILNEACRQAKMWQDSGLGKIRVAVNIAPRQFLYSDIVATTRLALAASGLGAECLELEITEGSIMEDAEGNIKKLRQLSDMGVQLAIDDFGTGYSSLAYLKRFPIDALKIDQSFVRYMDEDKDDAKISSAVVSLGQSLGLRVVAEGVEKAEHLDYLRKLRCDEAQGFFIARPMPADKLTEFLRQNIEFVEEAAPVKQPTDNKSLQRGRAGSGR